MMKMIRVEGRRTEELVIVLSVYQDDNMMADRKFPDVSYRLVCKQEGIEAISYPNEEHMLGNAEISAHTVIDSCPMTCKFVGKNGLAIILQYGEEEKIKNPNEEIYLEIEPPYRASKVPHTGEHLLIKIVK